MSSSASSWRRGRTWSASRWPAISSGCRTRCRRSRKPRRKRRSPPRSAGRSPRCSQASARRSPPPRLRRCIAPRSRPPTGRAPSPSRSCGPASNGASTPICAPSPSPRVTPKISPPKRGGCGSSKWSTPCGARSRSRWTSAWRRPRSRKWPRTPRTIRIFACPRSTGTAPPRKC